MNDDLTPIKEKIEEVLRLVESRADKAQRGKTLVSSSLQQDEQNTYAHLQLFHRDLELTGSHHAWSLGCTENAVAQLVMDTKEAKERDRQATAGAIAAVEERSTIAQLRNQQELEETRWFNQHQSNQTCEAIDRFVMAQLPVIIEKVVVEPQKQLQTVAESSRPLPLAPEIQESTPQYPSNQFQQYTAPANSVGVPLTSIGWRQVNQVEIMEVVIPWNLWTPRMKGKSWRGFAA